MAKVALLRCMEYEEDRVRAKLEEGLSLISYSIPDLSGKKVLIKPNLLAAAPPESAVCTHPIVVKVLIELFQRHGAEVWVGDSPAIDSVEKAARVSGIMGVVKETGATLVDFSETVEVEVSEGCVVRRLPLAKAVTDADFIVSASKLKTHGLTRFTGTVKNLFGCIPGKRKAQFHLRMSEIADFAGLLLDIYSAVAPDLVVIDGIIGMEGAGPRNGHPCKMESLLISTDGHSCDQVACELIGLAPHQVPTLRMAASTGRLDPLQVETVGETTQSIGLAGLVEIPRDTRGSSVNLPDFILRRLTGMLTAKPVLIPDLCAGCGICVDACPPHTIRLAANKAEFNYTHCIRCYCCQELCPRGAIRIQTSWLSRLFESR